MKLPAFIENIYFSGFPSDGLMSAFVDYTQEIEYKKLKSNSNIFNNPLVRVRVVFKDQPETMNIRGLFGDKALKVKLEDSEPNQAIFTSKLYRGLNRFTIDLGVKSWDLLVWHKSIVRDWVEGLARAVILIVGLNTFILQGSYIPSASMMNTLIEGDYIWVNKAAYYFREPRRGDVVVFNFPLDPSRDFIKRLIGLPGDEIEIRDKKLYINQKPVEESYTILSTGRDFREVTREELFAYKKDIRLPEHVYLLEWKSGLPINQQAYFSAPPKVKTNETIDLRTTQAGLGYYRESKKVLASPSESVVLNADGSVLANGSVIPAGQWKAIQAHFVSKDREYAGPGDNIGPFKVAPGHYLVLGDNRDNSLDSRFWGLVPRGSLKGQALFLYWPLMRARLIHSEELHL